MTEHTHPGDESWDSNEEDDGGLSDYFSFDEDDQETLDPDTIDDLSGLFGSLDNLDDPNCPDSVCR